MSTTKRGVDGRFLIEHRHDRKGACRTEVHGPSCARTREVVDALERGTEPRHPDDPAAARCGPAMVNSDAYRSNWETIFGGRAVVGVA